MDDRELRRKAEVAELLLDAARQFGEGIEPQRVYERFHELLAGVIQHDGLIISWYDPKDDVITCHYAWTDGATLDPAAFPSLPLNREGGGMQSRVIVTGEPLLFNDVQERVQTVDGVFYNVGAEGKPEPIPESGPSGTSAAMMTPVKHEGQVVGVVQLMTDSGQYTDEQLELFDGLVAQMGAAVRTARLQEERRRLEVAEAAARAVAAEREEAARVLEAVGDGVFLLDGAGVVRFWNRAAALLTGVPAESVLGRQLEDLIPDWSAIGPRIDVAEEAGAVPRPVTLPVGVEGHDLWLSFVAVQSRDGVVYAFRDLTTERQLEEEKSDFVATISHELRTPMTAVYGAAQTLLRNDVVLEEETQLALLKMIASQAARLTQITEEVLLTTRLDRGDIALERTPVDVGDVVRSAVEAVRTQLTDEVPIELDLPADVSRAFADPDRLEQVLVNLLDNAAKYGAAPVRVRAEASNGLVRISVSDEGPGVAPADRTRIFEKFYRADPRMKRSPSGTGLGLYISRELTRRMGGRLELVSDSGAGATFVVELPRS